MISSEPFTDDQKQALLDALQTLSVIFWGPDLEKCQKMLEEVFFHPFEEIDKMMNYEPHDALNKLKLVIADFSDANYLYHHLEESYIRLFISSRDGIVAPLYQSCYEYENAPLMGNSAMMVKKLFESKGLSLANDINEPPDHLSIELEYLFFLLEKGWREKDKMLITSAGSFASEVMLPWIDKFRVRLMNETRCHFYPLISSILVSVINIITLIERK